MTVNPRRPTFRLPWTDGANEPANAEPANAEPATPASPEDNSPAPAPPDATDADKGGMSPVAEASEPVAASDAVAEEEAPASDEFLHNLVDAMRGVAQESRDANLADLRRNVDVRIEHLRATAAERAEELRRGSELDIIATGDWEKAEIDRVKADAERRVAAHRAELEKQLADHRASSEREIEATRRRLSDYERDLTAFFTQLSEIHDPAVFVAAAKRMPRGPELLASPSDAGASAEPATEGAPGASVADTAADPSPDETSEEQATSGAAGEAAADDASKQNGTPEATADAPDSQPAVESAPPIEAVETRLAKRLAELDKRLSTGEATKPAPGTEIEPEHAAETAPEPDARTEAKSATATEAKSATATEAKSATATEAKSATATEAPTEDSNGELSTAIMVKGLGSFGAITSFKQALERADGIQGVTLSLGPGGEFVYRANHAPGFDLVAAIRAIEGQAVNIDEADGSLMVTIQRGR